jgi:hypothetical protein
MSRAAATRTFVTLVAMLTCVTAFRAFADPVEIPSSLHML